MKWITHEHVKVDRVACPWLIKKFVDQDAEFLFVPTEQVREVAEREGATPYDVKNVELGHHGKECSFEAILKKYGLTSDPALVLLGKIVSGSAGGGTERRGAQPCNHRRAHHRLAGGRFLQHLSHRRLRGLVGTPPPLFLLALLMAATGAVFSLSSFYPLLLVAAFFGTLGTSASETAPFLPIEQAILSQITAQSGRRRSSRATTS